MTLSAPVRVLLADDEPLIRAGVRAILAGDPCIEVVAEAEDGAEAVELARRHRPDVAVLDIRMPRVDGLAAGAEIRRLLPEAAVVILTTFGEDAYIAKAIDGGATGFLLKSGDPRELIAGIRAAAEGAAYLGRRRLSGDVRGRVLLDHGKVDGMAAMVRSFVRVVRGCSVPVPTASRQDRRRRRRRARG